MVLNDHGKMSQALTGFKIIFVYCFMCKESAIKKQMSADCEFEGNSN